MKTAGVKTISDSVSPVLSIISPALDEEAAIEPLYKQILAALDSSDFPFEIIFIDDGSRDGTYNVMRRIYENDKRVCVLHFHNNQGKSAALSAGFHAARGDYIVTLDADLQDDPEEIPKLLLKLDEGFDLVSGWKRDRQDSKAKIWFSKLFNYCLARTSRIPIHDFNCGLKCYRREVIEQLRLHGKLHRFIPVIASWYGFRVTEVPVKHHPRTSGRSKYGFLRIPRGFYDFCTVWFLTHYRERPSHFFHSLGIITFLLSWLILIASIVCFGFSSIYMGFLLTIFSLGVGLIAVHLILIGLLAEFITHYFSRYEASYYVNETLKHD